MKNTISLYEVLEKLTNEQKNKEAKKLRSAILFLNSMGVHGNVYVPQFIRQGRKLRGQKAKDFKSELLLLAKKLLLKESLLISLLWQKKYSLDPGYVQKRAQKLLSSMVKIRTRGPVNEKE